MNPDIEKLREIYVAQDVDVETRTDNLAVIREWEKRLRELEGFSRWQGHEVTQEIIAQAKKSYVDHSLLLARSRDLNDTARHSLWAKQDAMMWLINLASEDVQGQVAHINANIKRALSNTN